ncbi:hypothetical protein T12_6816 [Trichinella patagoniensis]|uniref:Uncharacterized protein n=1 Tax=Trichinella patagoniensis TaxID=990121 RepID=A0A0V1A7D0_9BILA|nr:hypothetical protein T12_6816 [Trichinella patagoniensis]
MIPLKLIIFNQLNCAQMLLESANFASGSNFKNVVLVLNQCLEQQSRSALSSFPQYRLQLGGK